ncbi:MAG: ATP-grasp domain-containing protein [Candidatus Freyarchaeota archaeon]|nr:ATP-grasp domain-containing protein [Candidatus Jordarchaeia archaeon]
MKNVLVVGFNARPIAAQAKMCGFRVFAVDYWGDVDVYRWVDDIIVVREHAGAHANFAELAVQFSQYMTQKHYIDGVLLGSGLDDRWDCLEKIQDVAPIVGNAPPKVRRARMKVELYDALKRIGVAVPETFAPRDWEDAVAAAWELGFPVVVRREAGGGGLGVHLARNKEEVKVLFNRCGGAGRVIVQEYVRGEDVSASVLCDGKRAATLTVNRQLIGVPWLGGREFAYCGNVVPHESENVCRVVGRTAEKICEFLGLVGSNGVDFVLKEGQPVFMEVNPRFQGTIECVSMVTGMNVVEKHIEACQGRLPEEVDVKGFAVKGIVYTTERSVIPDLRDVPFIYDITKPGEVVDAGSPVCSIQLTASTPEKCMKNLREITSIVYSKLRRDIKNREM